MTDIDKQNLDLKISSVFRLTLLLIIILLTTSFVYYFDYYKEDNALISTCFDVGLDWIPYCTTAISIICIILSIIMYRIKVDTNSSGNIISPKKYTVLYIVFMILLTLAVIINCIMIYPQMDIREKNIFTQCYYTYTLCILSFFGLCSLIITTLFVM